MPAVTSSMRGPTAPPRSTACRAPWPGGPVPAVAGTAQVRLHEGTPRQVAAVPEVRMSLRRSLCFYTPSADPSGMGVHMLDLVAESVGTADVSLLARRDHRAGWLLDRAAELAARTVPLPSPRHPAFGQVITDFLR